MHILRYLKVICFLSIFLSIPYSIYAFDSKISIELNGVALEDALQRVSERTGVAIELNGILADDIIEKSYHDLSLEAVLKDLFQGHNMVALFGYTGQALSVIKLWSLPEGAGLVNIPNTYSANSRSLRSSHPRGSNQSMNTNNVSGRSTVNRETVKAQHETPQLSGISHKPSFSSFSFRRSVVEAEQTIQSAEAQPANEASSQSEADYSAVELSHSVAASANVGGLEAPPMPPGMVLSRN